MSIVWNEEDDAGIESLKILKKEKMVTSGLLIPENSGDAEFYVAFKVEDYWKANHFLMDLMYGNKEDLTGIKVTSVGFNKNSANISEALRYLRKAQEILNQI